MWDSAIYLYPDGTFISPKQILQKDHSNHLEYDRHLANTNQVQYPYRHVPVLEHGAIALNDGTNYTCEKAYIEFPQFITSKQKEQLILWLDHVMMVSSTVQVVSNHLRRLAHYTFVSLQNENGYLPEEIVKDLIHQGIIKIKDPKDD